MMADDVTKLTPFKDGARRRMFMKTLTAVAILPNGRGANPESNVTFYKSDKSADKQEETRRGRRRRRRRGDKDYEKQEGPRSGESFSDFLSRMREAEPGMSRARARRMFDGDMDKAGGDVVDIVTSVDSGHQHGVSVYIYDEDVHLITSFAGEDRESNHDHQLIRNDDGSYSVLENFGHSHDDISADDIMMALGQRLLEKEAAGEELPEKGPLADILAAAKESENQPPEGDSEMADDKELDALKAQVATLTAVAALTGVHKTHYDTLGDDDKAAFLKLDGEGKDAAVKSAAEKAEAEKEEADPVVYKSESMGMEFRKSHDPLMVQMAKQMDEDRKENIKLRKRAEDQALEKRAENELANLPGDLATRKALLKAAESIADESEREAAVAALKAQNAKLAPAFKTVGVNGEPVVRDQTAKTADDELDRLAKERAAKDGIDFYTAYDKVSGENPDLLKQAMG